jgi:hypothetical protein
MVEKEKVEIYTADPELIEEVRKQFKNELDKLPADKKILFETYHARKLKEYTEEEVKDES